MPECLVCRGPALKLRSVCSACPDTIRWYGKAYTPESGLDELTQKFLIRHKIQKDGHMKWQVRTSGAFTSSYSYGFSLQEALDDLLAKIVWSKSKAQQTIATMDTYLGDPPDPPQTPLWDHLIKS